MISGAKIKHLQLARPPPEFHNPPKPDSQIARKPAPTPHFPAKSITSPNPATPHNQPFGRFFTVDSLRTTHYPDGRGGGNYRWLYSIGGSKS